MEIYLSQPSHFKILVGSAQVLNQKKIILTRQKKIDTFQKNDTIQNTILKRFVG